MESIQIWVSSFIRELYSSEVKEQITKHNHHFEAWIRKVMICLCILNHIVSNCDLGFW